MARIRGGLDGLIGSAASLTRIGCALVVAAAVLVDRTAAQLSLAGHCNVQTAQFSKNWLGMYCNNLNTASFGYNWTWINLDWCVANNGGALVGRKNGYYHSTCTRCSTAVAALSARPPSTGAFSSDDTLDLRCACLDCYGRQSVASSLDLNTILVDVDGTLGCYGRLGNKTLAGPPATG